MISLKPNAPFLEYPPSGAKICYDLVRGHYLFWVANSFATAFFQFCSNQETKMAARRTQRSASTISRKNRGMWTVKNIWCLIIIQYMTGDRYATDSRPIFHRQSMINVSVKCWPTYLGRHINRYSTDISTDLSIDMSTDISRSICRSSVGQHIDRYIGWVSVDMSTDTRPTYRPIHRSRGAQNTHDPESQ